MKLRTPKPTLKVLLIADYRPGHYNQSEGIVAALERRFDVNVKRLDIRRRRWAPGRLLRHFLGRGVDPSIILRAGYGFGGGNLGDADLVVSTGGDTLAANIAAAQILRARNIYCGSAKGAAIHLISLGIASYKFYDQFANHVVTLKPTTLDPSALNRPSEIPRFSARNPPATGAMLIGGNSRNFRFTVSDWINLTDFMKATAQAWGMRWVLTTSRRTPREGLELLSECARDKSVVKLFIDYRWSGPSTLMGLLRLADAVVCTSDSSTMMSEAITARFPVVDVTPADHSFDASEATYREFMRSSGWSRRLAISALTPETFGEALSQITPLATNHLDDLADIIAERLPELFNASD